MRDDFIVLYVKDDIGYLVVLNEEQLTLINNVCEGLFKLKVTIVDKLIGMV